jgi:hypothetical protein
MATKKEIVVVIAPGPTILVPLIDAFKAGLSTAGERQESDAEDWSLHEPTYQMLLARLGMYGEFVPVDSGGIAQTARVVILSGDVHYGFSVRLQYWAEKPFGGGGQLQMVVAQLTSSSLRNESTTRDARTLIEKKKDVMGASTVFHEHGYTLTANQLPDPGLGFGWNNSGGKKREVGDIVIVGRGDPQLGVPQISTVSLRRSGDPVVVKLGSGPFPSWLPTVDITLADVKEAPHWKYRVDYLLAEHEVEARPPFKPRDVGNPPPKDRLRALQSYLAVAGNRGDYLEKFGNGKEVVGVNNFGEVTFLKRTDGGHDVVHQLWWRLKRRKKSDMPSDLAEAAFYLSPHPLSRWIVSMQFADSRYPEPPVKVRP